MLKLRVFSILAATLVLLLSVQTGVNGDAPKVRPVDDKVELKELRISAIPDSDAKKVEEKSNLIGKYLSEKLGIPVKFMPQQNYAACVTGLATDQLELVWFGGVTGVQADMKMDGKCTFVACRDVDKKFKSYFIANKGAKIGALKDLNELADLGDEKTFTFGSKGSTSGHVMPRHFFEDQAGEKPEDVFKKVAYCGSHDKTIRDVADGTADFGALNYKNWDTAKDDIAKAKEKCEIIYTTPEYVDYVWVARDNIGAEWIKKIKQAILALDSKNETDAKILEAWGTKAGKFVECEKKDWDGIKKVLDAGVDVG